MSVQMICAKSIPECSYQRTQIEHCGPCRNIKLYRLQISERKKGVALLQIELLHHR